MEEQEYIRLIAKHLNQETSPAEEKDLLEWLDADPAHRMEFTSIKKLWAAGSAVTGSRGYDTQAAWTKVDAVLTGPSSSRRLPRIRKMLAAASIIIVIGAGWWFYRSYTSSSLMEKLATEDVSTITLSDGSKVWLRKGARLAYPPAFGKDVREVRLTGEAFFMPAADAAHPFRIITKHVTVEDIATSFLVNDQEPEAAVIVQTGKVKLTSNDGPPQQLLVSSGEKATIRNNKLSLFRQGTPNYDSWKTGLLEFRQIPLTEVVQDISDHYRSPVSIAPDLQAAAAGIKVTARFDHQPLHQVLDELRLTTGLRTIQEKDTLFFVHQ